MNEICQNTPVQGGVARSCRRPAAPGDTYCTRCRSAARTGERRRARRNSNLVVYGTLRQRATLELVLGHAWEGEYEGVRVPGWEATPHHYGGILFARPKVGVVLEALLVRGLTTEDFERLDRYESVGRGMYRRVEVEVWVGLSPGSTTPAWIYADGQLPDLEEGVGGPTGAEMMEGYEEYRQKYEGAGDFTPEEMEGILEGRLTVPESAVRRADRQAAVSLEDLLLAGDGLTVSGDWPVGPTVANDGTSGGSGVGDGSLERRGPSGSPRWPASITPPWRPRPLFAYGALAFREVLEERIGHHWRGDYVPAQIEGYRVEPGWPRHVVPHQGGVVHGFLIFGLSEQDVLAIDRYEGTAAGYYERILVKNRISRQEVWLYITGPAGYRRLDRRRVKLEPARRTTISGQGEWPTAAPFRIRGGEVE